MSLLAGWLAAINEPTPPAVAPTGAAEPSRVSADRAGSEWNRIARLPVVDYFDKNLFPDVTDSIMKPGAPRVWKNSRGHTISGLNDCQNALFHCMRAEKGAVGAIAVGGGKAAGGMLTGIAVQADLVVMLAPPTTLHQVRQTYADWRKPFDMRFKFLAHSYAWVSQTKNARELSQVFGKARRPLLILDEAHMLANPTSARTKRVMRLLENRPDIMVLVMSGTLMSKSLKQMAHLVKWALRERSPVPHPDTELLLQWANVVDVDGRPGGMDFLAANQLVSWSTKMPPQNYENTATRQRAVREAFAHRFHSAAGVVATTKSALGTSLEIYTVGTDPKEPKLSMPREVKDCLEQIDTYGEIRLGDSVEILPDMMARYRAKRLLSMGFFMRWDWPKKPNGVPDVDHDWMDARSSWFKFVRAELKDHSHEGYDSEKLVRMTIASQANDPSFRKHDGHYAYQKWAIQSQKRWQGKRQPPSLPVWVSSFYVDWIVAWVEAMTTKTKPVLVWYESLALRDALIEKGLEVLSAGQGTDWTKARNLVVSLKSHSTGIDMPAWHRMLIAEPPPSGDRWEQTLGRVHREGQLADLVEVYVPLHSDVFKKAWRSALRSADAIQSAMRNEQKLCYATLADGVPDMFDESDNLDGFDLDDDFAS